MDDMQSQRARWQVFETTRAVCDAACQAIMQSASEAIAQRGRFCMVLAGGTTPREVYLQLRDAQTDWSKWQVYFGDERCLPPEHAERNSRMARQAWLDLVPIPASNVHAIPAELGPEEGAAAYCRTLEKVGEFDLVLLGFGEDGHTASLFPDHPWEANGAAAIPVYDAPKPPPERVSLAASRLSAARRVIFLVIGAGKKQAVEQWENGALLPATAILPPAGVEVYLDASVRGGEPHRLFHKVTRENDFT